jgi:hypothetical protein
MIGRMTTWDGKSRCTQKQVCRKAIQSEDGGSNEECVWWGGLNERERVGREAVWKQYNDAVSSNSNRRAATQ